MPDIARLDEDGVLVAVETVRADAHRTDLQARSIALPDGHDMRQRLNAYRWDFRQSCFLPLSGEPLDVAERDTPGLIEGLVQAIEHIEQQLKTPLPKRSQDALRAYRRRCQRTGARRQEPGPRRQDPGRSLTGMFETSRRSSRPGSWLLAPVL